MNHFRVAINSMSLDGKLGQGDHRWAAFNDSFEDMEIEPLELANYIYGGHAYSSWMGGRRRKNDHFVSSQWLGIDMDTEDERSSFDALMKHPWVANYGNIVHSTDSDKENAPRSRVVFLLDEPIDDPTKYKAASNFLMTQFDGADTVCKDPARFFFGSKNCNIELPLNVLPLRTLRDKFAQWKDAHPDHLPSRRPENVLPPQTMNAYREQREQRFVGRKEAGSDLDKARAWCSQVDPWAIDYTKWIAILGALHDEIGDAALPLAEEWAKGQPGEVRRKWKSFGNYSGRRATLASLCALAKAV